MSDNEAFYQLKAKTNTGEELEFSSLRDKVILVVNVASQCGFTPQYKGLEEIHQKYKDKGLCVLGFPCNQFGSQEPGTNDEIISFCQKNYGVSFQIMDKVEVNGDNVHPVYEYLKSQKSQLLMSRIKWNFEKFLVDKTGVVVSRYSSITAPQDLDSEIAKLLEPSSAL